MFSLKLRVTIPSSDFFGSNFYNHFQQLTLGDLNAFSALLSPAEGSLFHLDEFEHHTEVHQGEIGDATVVVLA